MKLFSLFFISIFLLGSIFSSVSAVESGTQTLECEYAGAYEQCRVAQQNNATRSMTDPLCSPELDAEKILDQIILDVKFKEIDEQAKQYLIQLSADKDKYF